MRNKFFTILIGICVLALAFSGSAFAKERVIFGGGPAGGTFQVVANGIQVYKPIKNSPDFSVKAQTSAGSVENLRKTNAGRQQMSTVYSGHVWLGRNGKMKNDPKKYENVLAVAWLYGAPAQLVVRQGSGIKSVKDLVGKKVGVGNAGSGAFANCELFFTHMGVWDKIERNAMGYNDAAAAFGNKRPRPMTSIWSTWMRMPKLPDSTKSTPISGNWRFRPALTRVWIMTHLPSRTVRCGWPIPRFPRIRFTKCSAPFTQMRVSSTCSNRKRPLKT